MNTTELNAIASEYGTPTFLFDTEALRKRMADIKEIVGEKVHLCYSIKANPFLIPAMLECVEKLEVCSPGELCICERLQVAPERIIYSGVSKREIDVEEALEYGADVYTAESLGHVKRLNAEAVKRGEVIPVILRLSAGSQFGMSKEDLCYISCSLILSVFLSWLFLLYFNHVRISVIRNESFGGVIFKYHDSELPVSP